VRGPQAPPRPTLASVEYEGSQGCIRPSEDRCCRESRESKRHTDGRSALRQQRQAAQRGVRGQRGGPDRSAGSAGRRLCAAAAAKGWGVLGMAGSRNGHAFCSRGAAAAAHLPASGLVFTDMRHDRPRVARGPRGARPGGRGGAGPLMVPGAPAAAAAAKAPAGLPVEARRSGRLRGTASKPTRLRAARAARGEGVPLPPLPLLAPLALLLALALALALLLAVLLALLLPPLMPVLKLLPSKLRRRTTLNEGAAAAAAPSTPPRELLPAGSGVTAADTGPDVEASTSGASTSCAARGSGAAGSVPGAVRRSRESVGGALAGGTGSEACGSSNSSSKDSCKGAEGALLVSHWRCRDACLAARCGARQARAGCLAGVPAMRALPTCACHTEDSESGGGNRIRRLGQPRPGPALAVDAGDRLLLPVWLLVAPAAGAAAVAAAVAGQSLLLALPMDACMRPSASCRLPACEAASRLLSASTS